MANKMTGVELVKFARGKIGTSYVYGMKGRKMSQSDFNELYKKYGDKFVPRSDIKKVGKVCVDCSGLISWATGIALGKRTSKNRSVQSCRLLLEHWFGCAVTSGFILV